MKRKFSLLINIATLILCVCAIAFGVYSAKTASLNVGGSVGFTAHNCKASVSAKVKNDAVKVDGTPDAEGTLNATPRSLGSVSVDEATATGSLPLGNIFFTDLTPSGEPATIELKITITNLSDFAITIDLKESKAEDTKVTVTPDKSTDSIETKNGTSVFTFEISLNKDGEEYPNVSQNLSIKFDLAKKAPDELAGTWVLYDRLNTHQKQTYSVNFVSNNINFVQLAITTGKGLVTPSGYNLLYDDSEIYYPDMEEHWVKGAEYKTITITSKLSEVENGDALLIWLKGNAKKEGSAPTLISFTIDGTSYQADECMTWAEWLDSSYNTAGFFYDYDNNLISKTLPDDSIATVYYNSDGVFVFTDDIVTAYYDYALLVE